MKILFFLGLVLFIQIAHAETPGEIAYCNYDMERARAERILNQVPSAMLGFGRNTSAINNTLGIGVTESLSKYLKGSLSNRIGDTDCRLYQIMNDIQKHVNYDLLDMQTTEIRARLLAIEEGIVQINLLISNEKERLTVGGSTLVNVQMLESAQAKFEATKAQLQQQVDIVYIPERSTVPLSVLLTTASEMNHQEQNLMAKQSSYDNWDVNVTIGEGSNPNLPMLHSFPDKTYGTISFSVNLGSRQRSAALYNSGKAYADWTDKNETGNIKLGISLKEQITKALKTAKVSATSFTQYEDALRSNLKTIVDIDSPVARAFRLQITIEQINNHIEAVSVDTNIDIMSKYLNRNFIE